MANVPLSNSHSKFFKIVMTTINQELVDNNIINISISDLIIIETASLQDMSMYVISKIIYNPELHSEEFLNKLFELDKSMRTKLEYLNIDLSIRLSPYINIGSQYIDLHVLNHETDKIETLELSKSKPTMILNSFSFSDKEINEEISKIENSDQFAYCNISSDKNEIESVNIKYSLVFDMNARLQNLVIGDGRHNIILVSNNQIVQRINTWNLLDNIKEIIDNKLTTEATLSPYYELCDLFFDVKACNNGTHNPEYKFYVHEIDNDFNFNLVYKYK